MWKFTGISVKYKTQIGTNDHKLSKILFTQTGRLIWKFQVQGYVFTVHDFCHERLRVGALAGISANQASLLALAAPKIQDSKFCPQICTDFKDFSQARKHIKVQDF